MSVPKPPVQVTLAPESVALTVTYSHETGCLFVVGPAMSGLHPLQQVELAERIASVMRDYALQRMEEVK